MISSFFVSSSSFFSCMLQCHFGSSEHVSLSMWMFSYGSKMIAVERTEEREQPTHYLQLIAVFVLVLITINYLIISIWIISYFFVEHFDLSS